MNLEHNQLMAALNQQREALEEIARNSERAVQILFELLSPEQLASLKANDLARLKRSAGGLRPK